MSITVESKFYLKSFLAQQNIAIRKTLIEGSLTIKGKAVSITPVDKGLLRSSLTYAIEGNAEDFKQVIKAGEAFKLVSGESITPSKGQAIIGTIVFYAPFVEFGTKRQVAQAFLLPAFNSSRSEIQNIFLKYMQQITFIEV